MTSGLALAHMILVSMWGGVVLVEVIVEVLGLRAPELAARLHFWIDVIAEIPLIAGVLVTGAILTSRIWPPVGLSLVKVSAALVAVAVNLTCAAFVLLRYRHRGDPAMLRRYGLRVFASGVGFPFAAVAAYIGLAYFA